MPKMKKTNREIQKISDEELVSLVEQGLLKASNDWLAGTALSGEREKSTLEYGMIPTGHLSPQGVSQIVSSDTVEAVEGYVAILSELLFDNNKLAKFTPKSKSPADFHRAKVASQLTNYVIFKQNDGWSILNSWVKSSLIWKNTIVRWGWVEDHEYKFEEFEQIDQNSLDLLLADDDVEVSGTLEYSPEVIEIDGEQTYVNMYHNVRVRRKKDKSRVRIDLIPPENFRISRDATNIDDAAFVGIESELTKSELKKAYPDADIDWDDLGTVGLTTKLISSEEATRKVLTAVQAAYSSKQLAIDTEANIPIQHIECWMKIDRDGDGIAELKHIVIIGGQIALEEDAQKIPIASLCPFEVPHEFIGLSMADMIRPSTLASTAILRGFIENVYMTNYAPKLADPNIVDFGALQNLKPKSVIPTIGNPQAAVFPLTPDTISQGTVPLMEFLQIHKEQSTGLSKAAQGLNDTLYVSGNSEQKVSMVQSAAQVRLQYMARRYVETGLKRFVEGVYTLMREKMTTGKVEFYDEKGYLASVDPAELPDCEQLCVDADVGGFGNTDMLRKMQLVGKEVIPALQTAGAGGAVNPQAAVHIAAETIKALDLDPLDYLVDYTTPEFQEQANQARQAEQEATEKKRQLDEEITRLDIRQREATIALTNIQSKNAIQDNTRQMVIAMSKHYQDMMKLYIDAAKEGISIPQPVIPSIEEMWALAVQHTAQDAAAPLGSPQVVLPEGGPAAMAPPADTTSSP